MSGSGTTCFAVGTPYEDVRPTLPMLTGNHAAELIQARIAAASLPRQAVHLRLSKIEFDRVLETWQDELAAKYDVEVFEEMFCRCEDGVLVRQFPCEQALAPLMHSRRVASPCFKIPHCNPPPGSSCSLLPCAQASGARRHAVVHRAAARCHAYQHRRARAWSVALTWAHPIS
eukprot:scaffold7842_cov27-Tisochrysis_lutea.AAC.4